MPLLILLIVVTLAGIVLVARGGPPTGQRSSGVVGGATPGLWGLVCGLVAAAGIAMIGQATFGWVQAFGPPDWLRVVTAGMLPLGVMAAAIFGALSLKWNSGRTLGIAGLVLAALSVVAFFVMVASVDY